MKTGKYLFVTDEHLNIGGQTARNIIIATSLILISLLEKLNCLRNKSSYIYCMQRIQKYDILIKQYNTRWSWLKCTWCTPPGLSCKLCISYLCKIRWFLLARINEWWELLVDASDSCSKSRVWKYESLNFLGVNV